MNKFDELDQIANAANPKSWGRSAFEFNAIVAVDKNAPLSLSGERIASFVEKRNAIFVTTFDPEQVLELIAIVKAAEKLVRCKGRYQSEQNYRKLAALFGVTTPDLPPLEGER
ncbi:conserved hypothetical protein [Xenorhabdus bovienii str. kraussei Becker Underwood]|uniref:Uncharacterized protein n=1 Tax=Xenorhabdus bovienii str. kraussei Becker Underwood TaxID=1398204 RepID=A0A077Q000_XENBV|nr:conserved hypothetical protein [Xenorhabdus bovienii str. kraussei Becker Underwood]